MGTHLPPGPSSMTSMPVLPKFQRPSNCSTVHLYHRIRNTRSVSPWDTIIRFMFLELASGRWKRPTSMSDRSVSLNPAMKITNSPWFFMFQNGRLFRKQASQRNVKQKWTCLLCDRKHLQLIPHSENDRRNDRNEYELPSPIAFSLYSGNFLHIMEKPT